MEIKLSVDRIENGIAVCYGNDRKYELPQDGLYEGLIILAKFDECGKFISFTPLDGETDREKKNLAARTKNLFNRNKNKA